MSKNEVKECKCNCNECGDDCNPYWKNLFPDVGKKVEECQFNCVKGGYCYLGYVKLIPEFEDLCKDNSNCYYKQLQQLKAENKKLKKGMELFKKYSCDECISATYDEETGERDFCESCCKGNINNLASQILTKIGGLND
jgi:hypothetical protein